MPYDELNGATGQTGPSQLSAMFPDTEFAFARRGQSGPDVTVTGGTHPSEYPNSIWSSESNFGDFKPNTESGARTFRRDISSGKLPKDTIMIPYDPSTGRVSGSAH